MKALGIRGFAVVVVAATSLLGCADDAAQGGTPDGGADTADSGGPGAVGDSGGGAGGSGGQTDGGSDGGGAGNGDAGDGSPDSGAADDAGVDGGAGDSGVGVDAGPVPFELSVPSSEVTVMAGEPATLEVTIVRDTDYEGAVTLSLDGLPSGVTSDVAEVTLTDTMTLAQFVLTASLSATPTTGVSVDVHASSSRGDASGVFTLVVSAPPNFTTSVPEGVATRQGSKPRIGVEITRGGDFTGPVGVSVTGLPGTISASPIVIASGETTADLVFDIDLTTPLQSYNVDVHFTAGVVDIVESFGISVIEAISVTVTPPASPVIVPVGTSLDVSFDVEGSTASHWTVTVSGLPSGITASPASIAVSNVQNTIATFTFTASNAASVGASSTATVSADASIADSGTLSDLATFGVEVGPSPAFTASTPTPSVELVRGQPMDVTVNVVRDSGFTDALDIDAPAAPPTLAVSSAGIAMGDSSGLVTLSPSNVDALDEPRSFSLDVSNGVATRQVMLSARTRSDDPDLDASFGYHGIDVTPQVYQHAQVVRCIDADACYRVTYYNTTVRKLDVAGVYDASYGTSGYFDAGASFHFAELFPNGDLLVGTYYGTTEDLRVMRLSPAGALVSSFGDAGVVSIKTTAAAGSIETPLQLVGQTVRAVVDAGGVYLVGQAGSSSEIAVVRLDNDGDLDTAFDGDGIVTSNVTGGQFPSSAIAWQGRLIVGRSQSAGVLLTAFTAAGALDTTFDVDGFATLASTGCNGAAPIAMYGAGARLVVARQAQESCTHVAFAVTTAGELDTSYGTGGYAVPDVAQRVEHAAFDGGGRLIAYGRPVAEDRLELRRYLADGTADSAFGGDGLSDFDLAPPGTYESATTLTVLPNGSYLLSGYLHANLNAYDLAFLP